MVSSLQFEQLTNFGWKKSSKNHMRAEVEVEKDQDSLDLFGLDVTSLVQF